MTEVLNSARRLSRPGSSSGSFPSWPATYDSSIQSDRSAADEMADTTASASDAPAAILSTDAPDEAAVDESGDEPARRSRRRRTDEQNQFTGTPISLQVKLPADLVRSLKLLSYDENVTLAELVLRFLTSSASVPRVHVTRRNAS